ncbi:MAG: C25 family cysteine peptidase [Candidatus Thermoplasmatota archaeon]
MKYKKIIALVIIFLIIAVIVLFRPVEKPKPKIEYKLPDEYIVLIDEPKDEFEMSFVSALSPIIMYKNKYHPFFILDNGSLDRHQLWTIEKMKIKDKKKLLFTNSLATIDNVNRQVSNVINYPISNKFLKNLVGFNGSYKVSSYKEAIWVSPLATIENKKILIEKRSFKSQEEVWDKLYKKGIKSNYVVITNPNDATIDNKWHVPKLSLLAGEIASYRKGYVLTDYIPMKNGTIDFGKNETLAELNCNATGILNMLKHINSKYGNITYIALVGSAAAVPQFELPDYSESEADKKVSSDVVYGFLDDNKYTMDASVGRIINYNVQGASNQIARTFGFELIERELKIKYSNGDNINRNWEWHGSSFNGFEITHKRMQATPGYYLCEDLNDEGLTYEYYGPMGISTGITSAGPIKEADFDPVLQGSGVMGYRGHGSWHGSFYTQRYRVGILENGSVEAEHARELFLPPQIALFASCENAKIHGMSYRGKEIEFERIFSISYLYGGAIALIGATEVSYSDIGQDFSAVAGRITGDHKWDKNNAMFAFFFDGILDHEEEYGKIGKAHQWMINRYIKNHGNTVTPLEQKGDGADWKQASMYVLYGDPAFGPIKTKPGANQKDEWHNGEDDS